MLNEEKVDVLQPDQNENEVKEPEKHFPTRNHCKVEYLNDEVKTNDTNILYIDFCYKVVPKKFKDAYK